jgi:site-specific DNA-methyltransferase (adenine-specific)
MGIIKPYYETELGRLYCGDCLEILPHLEPADAVVTDPPYGLSFMGKAWDHGVPGVQFWESLQAKPGAFMLAFGGTRTFHRLTCAIEDAGWEIRDCMMWIYGSGFPKSLDISKAIDKAAGAEREVTGKRSYGDGHIQKSTKLIPPIGTFKRTQDERTETAPATASAREWSGWGTALKPAWEPIIVARRPIEGTVAANVLKYGTGGIDVDGCRVASNGDHMRGMVTTGQVRNAFGKQAASFVATDSPLGRWPANVIHDSSDEVMAGFPQTGGGAYSKSGGRDLDGPTRSFGSFNQAVKNAPDNYGDTGSAARFFYTAKASRRDRAKYNTHPTVKPFKLVRYLTRLVSKRGALVLDPFAGSCTLAVVCEHLRRRWLCIELEEAHCEIAVKRIEAERRQLKLF